MEERKVRFKDLSGWLKLAVIFGWLVAGWFTLVFIYGFMYGLLGL